MCAGTLHSLSRDDRRKGGLAARQAALQTTGLGDDVQASSVSFVPPSFSAATFTSDFIRLGFIDYTFPEYQPSLALTTGVTVQSGCQTASARFP